MTVNGCYFSDKHAVFATVGHTVVGKLDAAFKIGMASGGDLSERIGRALGNQFDVLANALACWWRRLNRAQSAIIVASGAVVLRELKQPPAK